MDKTKEYSMIDDTLSTLYHKGTARQRYSNLTKRIHHLRSCDSPTRNAVVSKTLQHHMSNESLNLNDKVSQAIDMRQTQGRTSKGCGPVFTA